MGIFNHVKSSSLQSQNSEDQALKDHIRDAKNSHHGDTYTTVEDVLQEVRLLEKRQCAQSQFRRIARYLEPVLDFLMMYSPALDIIVQYDAMPSCLVWGSLKALLKVLLDAVRSYKFIECGLIKLGDILSSSVRYEKMFEEDSCVRKALKELYLEILLFLQRIRSTVSKKSYRLVVESVFCSVDMQFHDNAQRLFRAHEVFKEEVTFAHRQKMQYYMEAQQLSNSKLDQIVVQTQRKICMEGDFRSIGLSTRASIASWLDPRDWSTALRQASKKRTPDTGVWILQDFLFQRWLRSSQGTSQDDRSLWIHGLPGAGKTVISSTIIEHIQTEEKLQSTKVAYFYSNFVEKGDRTAFGICVSAIAQLLEQCEEIPTILFERHRIARHHGRSKISEKDEVLDIFQQVVQAFPSVYLVIDGLDECTDIPNISSWLENAVESLPCLHVLFLSRDTASIRKALGQYSTIQMNAASTKSDIDKYLGSTINSLPSTDHQTKDRVFETLSWKAEGMFLLADLCMQMLRGAINEEDIQNILTSIPDGVYEMYMLILRRLGTESDARRCLAQRVLRLICFSAQAMTWPELCFALSWSEEQQSFERNREPFKDTVCDLCCPLIEYQNETDTFRLVHHTLYEFLSENCAQTSISEDLAVFRVQERDVQRELASMTLACMADEKVFRQITLNFDSCPLVAYATKNWCEHLSRSAFDRTLCARYLKFIACPERRSTWILRWLLSEERAFPLQQVVKEQNLLRDWIIECEAEQPSPISVLNDTQRALFQLDKIQSAPEFGQRMNQFRSVSNFERLICVRDLAREYKLAGQIGQGIVMFESALREAEKFAGLILPSSCWILNSIGILYDQEGKTHLSQKMQIRALAIQEEWLPPQHLDIVLTMNELGRIARHLEDFKEAENLHRRALDILQDLFPQSDLQIVWTKNALGRALLKQNKPEEAISLHQEVLVIEDSRLGRDHPHTLWTLSDIARCYHAQNNIESAISIQKEVMERSEKALGIHNADALWAKNSLGNFYELSGQIDMARNIHAKALAGQMEHLGADHAHSVWSRRTLERLGNVGGSHDG